MSNRWVSLLLALLLLPAASPQQHSTVNATTAHRGAAEEEEFLPPLSTSEKQGYGCLIAGGASLAATALVGSTEVILTFTGATALPGTNPVGIGLAVAGTVFASSCAVGALIAPTALRLWRYYYDGMQIAPEPVAAR